MAKKSIILDKQGGQQIAYLKDRKIIGNYTITINDEEKLSIRIFMKNNQFLL